MIMHKNLRLIIANRWPFIGKYRRFLRAYFDTWMPTRHTYSQHEEDLYVLNELALYNLKHSIYIDVGANHPTSLSNTFLLYKHKLTGIIIEPNRELVNLHRIFRPLDIALCIGCGDKAELGKFQILTTPVLSYFERNIGDFSSIANTRIWKTEYIPILPLDKILNTIKYEWISFLSIDTEGFDYFVLQGAIQTLKNTLVICIESNSQDEEEQVFNMLLLNNFEIIKRLPCNILARNKSLLFEKYKVSAN